MTAIAVTIAGSDSGGGAGIQADIKTFSALGVYAASVITALTAQNTTGVSAVHAVPPDFVAKQMDAVFSDLRVNATKIGMLANAAVIEEVAKALDRYETGPIILDPVMVATSGDSLFDRDAHQAMVNLLFPKVGLITPNLHEASILTGREIASDDQEMVRQANILAEKGVGSVLVKGGHGKGDEARDYWLSGDDDLWLGSPWIMTNNTHGTGCTLSSAIAAFMAKGQPLKEACQSAKDYISAAIKAADDLAIGKGLGPLHHFYDIWQP